MSDPGPGEGYSTTSNSRHFMAVSLLKMHQIFMLAFAGLRVEGEVAQVLVVSQPPPLAFLVFLLSDQAGALERQKKHQEDIFISK